MNSRAKWSDEELALLDSWTGTDADLSEALGRTPQAVKTRRWRRINPLAAETDRRWAEENRERRIRVAYLRQRVHRDRLNAAVRARGARDREAATRVGPFDLAEDALVLRGDLTTREIGVLLGRTSASVRLRRRRLLNRGGELDPPAASG